MAVSLTRVIVVTGYPRSGTTLIARMLSQSIHGVAVGELFDRIQTSPEIPLCGCGQRFAECEFWNPVIKATFGRWNAKDFADFGRLAQSVGRSKHLPQLACSRIRSRGYQARMEELLQILEKLYQNVQAISGSTVIVDSSKSPAFPFLLMQNPALDVRAVQLIRDSRAVAYSVLRRSNAPDAAAKDRDVPMTDFAEVAGRWTLHNLVSDLERMLAKNWLCIHYEQFAAEPIRVMRSILGHIGEIDPDLSCFSGSDTVNLQRNHIIGANRNRFEVGERSIRSDNEWQTTMSWREKSLVTFITLPMLLRHRYPIILPA